MWIGGWKFEFGENYFDVGYFAHSWLYPVKFTDLIDMHIVRKNDRKFGHGKMGLLYLLIFRKNSPEKNMEK